jgi:hypothetical protein
LKEVTKFHTHVKYQERIILFVLVFCLQMGIRNVNSSALTADYENVNMKRVPTGCDCLGVM